MCTWESSIAEHWSRQKALERGRRERRALVEIHSERLDTKFCQTMIQEENQQNL